jgi:hypothetical protein
VTIGFNLSGIIFIYFIFPGRYWYLFLLKFESCSTNLTGALVQSSTTCAEDGFPLIRFLLEKGIKYEISYSGCRLLLAQ